MSSPFCTHAIMSSITLSLSVIAKACVGRLSTVLAELSSWRPVSGILRPIVETTTGDPSWCFWCSMIYHNSVFDLTSQIEVLRCYDCLSSRHRKPCPRLGRDGQARSLGQHNYRHATLGRRVHRSGERQEVCNGDASRSRDSGAVRYCNDTVMR